MVHENIIIDATIDLNVFLFHVGFDRDKVTQEYLVRGWRSVQRIRKITGCQHRRRAWTLDHDIQRLFVHHVEAARWHDFASGPVYPDRQKVEGVPWVPSAGQSRVDAVSF